MDECLVFSCAIVIVVSADVIYLVSHCMSTNLEFGGESVLKFSLLLYVKLLLD